MTTAHATHTPGPMERIVRRDAYLGEQDSILQAAIKADADRSALLAALEAALVPCATSEDVARWEAKARAALAQARDA